MAKVIFEFDMDTDSDRLDIAMKHMEMYLALSKFRNWLRAEIKHNDKPYNDVWDEFHRIINECEVDLDL